MSADRDGPGWRTRANRRAKDLAFLESLRWVLQHADMVTLWRIAIQHRKGPRWRQVAIERAARQLSLPSSNERKP